MISGFAWRRRLRNLFAAVCGFAVLALLMALLFRVELPSLDWVSRSARVLTEPPAAVPVAAPVASPLDAGVPNLDASVPDPDAGVEGQPDAAPSLTGMEHAHRLLRRGDPWKALLAFEVESDRRPRSPEPLYWMGVSYVRLGNYLAAQTQFRRALQLDARHVASIYGLADALRLSADTKEAAIWYRRYLKLAPRGRYRAVASRAVAAFGG